MTEPEFEPFTDQEIDYWLNGGMTLPIYGGPEERAKIFKRALLSLKAAREEITMLQKMILFNEWAEVANKVREIFNDA